MAKTARSLEGSVLLSAQHLSMCRALTVQAFLLRERLGDWGVGSNHSVPEALSPNPKAPAASGFLVGFRL